MANLQYSKVKLAHATNCSSSNVHLQPARWVSQSVLITMLMLKCPTLSGEIEGRSERVALRLWGSQEHILEELKEVKVTKRHFKRLVQKGFWPLWTVPPFIGEMHNSSMWILELGVWLSDWQAQSAVIVMCCMAMLVVFLHHYNNVGPQCWCDVIAWWLWWERTKKSICLYKNLFWNKC